MQFSDFLPQVYRIVEDEGQFAWPNSAVALHLQEAVRDVANKLGLADTRVELSLVEGNSNYLLPAGIRRVNNVRILPAIPAGGTQAQAGPPLAQCNSLAEFPVVNVQNDEPARFVMSAVEGSNEDQFQITLNPAPARSATAAIIVNTGIEYPFTSADPAAGGDLTQLIPFPPQYLKVIIYKTASGMLSERVDESDIRRGIQLNNQADEWLEPMLPVKSTQHYAQPPRAFP